MRAPQPVERAHEPRPVEPALELDPERPVEAGRAGAPQLAIDQEQEAVGAAEPERPRPRR